MGMGSTGSSNSSSSGKSKETQLSLEQAAILKSRESQYQQFFFPEMVSELKKTNDPAEQLNSLQPQIKAINTGYLGAKSQLNADLQRRGIADSGIAVQGTTALQQARVSSLSEAYAKASAEQQAKKLQLLQMGGSMSPTPTSAAPLGSTQKSESGSGPAFLNYIGGWGN
jgi:hypothetical protein